MDAKLQKSVEPWVDPDDAPEITDELLENTIWHIGDRMVTRAEAIAEAKNYLLPPVGNGSKIVDQIIIDPEVLRAFKAMGPGWQNLMNDALREWLAKKGE